MKLIKLAVLLLAFQTFAQNSIGFTSVEVNQSESFLYGFNLTNDQDIKAVQFDISFNSTAFNLLSSHELSSRAAGFSVSASKLNDTTLRVILFSLSGAKIAPGSGNLLSLDLQSKTLPGTYTSTISNVVVSNASGTALSVSTATSSIKVKGAILKVNTATVAFGRIPLGGTTTKTISINNEGNEPLIITSTTVASPFSVTTTLPLTIAAGSSANVTIALNTAAKYDSAITVRFVSNDMDALRNLQSTAISAIVYAVNEIHIGTGTGEIHTDVSIPVTINNMEPFNGFQFDVQLPTNIAYVANSVQLSSRKTNHVVSASVISGNVLRIIAYSINNENFSGLSGEVLTFKLTPDVSYGTYQLKIQNPIITHNTLGDIESDSFNGSIIIKSPNLVTSVTTYNFGRIAITEPHTKTITLTNTGNADLNISGIVYDQSKFRITKIFPIILTPNQSDVITVEVIKNTTGTFDENISIRHNDPDAQNVVNLKGDLFSPNYMTVESKTIVLPAAQMSFGLNLNNNNGVKAIQFDMVPPAAFDLATTDFSINGSLTNFNLSVSKINSTTFRFIVYTLGTDVIPVGVGKIVNVNKTISASIADGEYPFAFSNLVISDAANNNIASEALVQGSVNIFNNTPPTTANINKTVTEQVEGSILLAGTDVNGDSLTYSIVSAPTNGTATITGNTLSYTSTSDTATSDSITYKANDGTTDSNVSTITITITPVNDLPVVADQSATLDEDTAKQITLSGTDADGDSLTFVLGTAAHGTLALSGNVVTYTPTANYNGADSFTYKAYDGTAYSNEATVSLSITSINDAPTTSNITQTVTEQVQASITLTGTDADNDALTYTIVGAPTNGTATITGNTLSYTSTSDTATSDSITYKANDGTTDSNVSTISITIIRVNNPPLATADAITLVQGTSATSLVGGSLSVLANDTDKENNPLTAVLVTGPKNGTLSLNPNGTFSYQHNGSAVTTDSFTYKANDGSDDSNVVTVNINVSPLTLTYNNFAIETKSESCSGMKNGEVIINATQSYNYVAHINGKDYNFVNNSVNISSLPPGTYPLCITIAGIAFEQCYNVTIAAGGSITGKSSIADNKLNVEITEGTAPFTVFVNGQSQFETSETNFSVAVRQGDLLEVQSAKSCEGVYSKTVVELPEAVHAYPNPTNGRFKIVVPTAKEQIYVEVFTMDAKLISKAYYPVENQSVQLNIENNANGVYLAKVGLEKPVNVIVIKN